LAAIVPSASVPERAGIKNQYIIIDKEYARHEHYIADGLTGVPVPAQGQSGRRINGSDP
jgi:hypothetical protein